MAAHRFVIMSSPAVRLDILSDDWRFMDGMVSLVKFAQPQLKRLYNPAGQLFIVHVAKVRVVMRYNKGVHESLTD